MGVAPHTYSKIHHEKRHFKTIFEAEELMENSVVKDFLTTADDGKNYEIKMYSLEAIIAVFCKELGIEKPF